MDKKYLILRVLECTKKEEGDFGRNQYLLKRLNEDKPIFDSDKKYLEKLLGLKIDTVDYILEDKKPNPSSRDKTIFLNPKLIQCTQCKNEIKLDEKSIRNEDSWYHSKCFEPVPKMQAKKEVTVKKIKKAGIDPVQILITVNTALLAGFLWPVLASRVLSDGARLSSAAR